MAEQQIEPFAYQKSTNIDEHNQIVDKLNEVVEKINDTNMDTINAEVATLKANVATNTSDIDSLADTVDAQATSIATNKTNIESLRDANILITKDIESIKETDTEQNASITALGNADIATVDSSFDTDNRNLKITLNPVSGSAIETTVNIPGGSGTADVTGTAPITVSNNNVGLNINTSTLKVDDNGQLTVIGGGGGGGGDYSATLPITIADNAIGIAYDNTLTLKDNKLSVVNTGTDYVAGTGITINDATIAVDETVIATKASVDSANIAIAEHTSDIVSLEQKYDSQSTAITELSTGVSNAISTANTANDTATEANTNVKDCYNSVSITDNVMTFGTVDGESKDITIPTSGGGLTWVAANTITDWTKIKIGSFITGQDYDTTNPYVSNCIGVCNKIETVSSGVNYTFGCGGGLRTYSPTLTHPLMSIRITIYTDTTINNSYQFTYIDDSQPSFIPVSGVMNLGKFYISL